MNFDITHILEHWDYQPGQVIVRRFKGKDGVEKLQLRVDLGLLQMNVDGRPDGKRPLGNESLFQHHLIQLDKYAKSHGGLTEGFKLKAEECGKLQQEAIQYHHRYICLYELQDYASVIRDTERNLRVFDFVEQYAENSDLSWSLQQFRPQLLLMHTRARGAQAVEAKRFDEAIVAIETGLESMRAFYRHHARQDLQDQSNEIVALEAWLQEIQGEHDFKTNTPMSEREKLELALEEAVQREDYEQAAIVRDALRNLKSSK